MNKAIRTSVVLTRFFFCLLTICWLSSCAMSPQTIAIKPDLKVSSMPIGRGRSLAVTTRDLRSNTSMGARGGLYNSAELTTDSRMTQSITQESIKVLQSWDFAAVPVALSNRTMPVFTVEMVDIDYQRPASSVGGNVSIKCRVAVKVDMGNSTFSGEYSSKRSETVAVQATSSGNVRLVNETVTQALEQIFKDPKLQRFLANY